MIDNLSSVSVGLLIGFLSTVGNTSLEVATFRRATGIHGHELLPSGSLLA